MGQNVPDEDFPCPVVNDGNQSQLVAADIENVKRAHLIGLGKQAFHGCEVGGIVGPDKPVPAVQCRRSLRVLYLGFPDSLLRNDMHERVLVW